MASDIYGNLYDYPQYYDILFGADWKEEFRFLIGCFERFAEQRVRRVFEPACGTGRLLVKLAQAGYRVSGNDLNEKAVAYCNARLRRKGFPASVRVGDMSDFQVARPVDAAFNLINTVRHLPTERAMESHLRCVHDALRPGGIYLLGLHLTPTQGTPIEDEAWTGRRGRVEVSSYMWSKELDRRKRNERLGIRFEIRTPTRTFSIEDEMNYRTYTAAQMDQLLDRVPGFEVIETYDFLYRFDEPIVVGPRTEDVVYVLRRQG
ncbi:MAG: class I SAM-dependent methyltransferase [Planctomyces sp.]|nr:class I SAM-dependent methyltransferase [Planctomyces sp.]